MSGSIAWYNGTNVASNAVGTSGQVLISQGASAPAWTTMAGGSSTYFQAVLSSSIVNATGDGTQINPIIFDSTTVNQGGGYDTSTGIFTCPTTDFYFFNMNLRLNGISTTDNVDIEASIQWAYFVSLFRMSAAAIANSGGGLCFTICGGAYLTASTTVQTTLTITGTVKGVTIEGNSDASTDFCGFSLH